jgi:chromosome segregation ATPase
MKKNVLLLITLFVFKIATYSQTQAYESKIDYEKTMQPVAMIELPYKTDVVEDAIKDYIVKKGFKTTSSKGFNVLRSFKLDDADTDLSDLYFKIEHKKKDKDYSVVTLLATKANQDILARPAADSTGQMDKAKSLLNKLAPYIDAHNSDVLISNQQDVLKKAHKKLDGYISDSTDLEKKIRNIHLDAEQNKSDVTKATHDMESALSADDDTKNKAKKKMNKLLDEQDNISKKLRKAQASLEETKGYLTSQYGEVDKQQQVLDAMKSKKIN